MADRFKFFSIGVFTMFIGAIPAAGQDSTQTVGLFLHDDQAYGSYTFFAPNQYTSSYLIDLDGQLVHQWDHEFTPGANATLLPDGHVLRSASIANAVFPAGGRGGRMQEFDWEGNLVWEFIYTDSLHALHHDMEPLPNGNILMDSWEVKTKEEAIAAGRDSTRIPDGVIWSEVILEVQPDRVNGGGDIVWQWDMWDHLIQDFDSTKANFGVVADHPELLDINFAPTDVADWLHVNSVDYNPDLDQVVFNSPRLGEFWVIDHGTTTEEAAGHSGGLRGRGGDFLYRWGNAAAYDATVDNEKHFFFQHDIHWIDEGLPGAGHFLLFNNGLNRTGGVNYSSVDELVPPLNADGSYDRVPGMPFGPDTLAWSYSAPNPTDFYAPFISSAQRLPNGNTFITTGTTGRLFEITAEGDIVWEYVNPVTKEGPLAQGDTLSPGPNPLGKNNLVFHATRYAASFPGFDGRDLTPMGTIEKSRQTGIEQTKDISETFALSPNYPNPFSFSTTIPFSLAHPAEVSVYVYNVLGQQVAVPADHRLFTAGAYALQFDASGLPSGVYFYRLEAGSFSATNTMLIAR